MAQGSGGTAGLDLGLTRGWARSPAVAQAEFGDVTPPTGHANPDNAEPDGDLAHSHTDGDLDRTLQILLILYAGEGSCPHTFLANYFARKLYWRKFLPTTLSTKDLAPTPY